MNNSFCIVNLYLHQIARKTKKTDTLVLVSTAGSAPTGTLKLPALGADVRPKNKIQNSYSMNSTQDSQLGSARCQDKQS